MHPLSGYVCPSSNLIMYISPITGLFVPVSPVNHQWTAMVVLMDIKVCVVLPGEVDSGLEVQQQQNKLPCHQIPPPDCPFISYSHGVFRFK